MGNKDSGENFAIIFWGTIINCFNIEFQSNRYAFMTWSPENCMRQECCVIGWFIFIPSFCRLPNKQIKMLSLWFCSKKVVLLRRGQSKRLLQLLLCSKVDLISSKYVMSFHVNWLLGAFSCFMCMCWMNWIPSPFFFFSALAKIIKAGYAALQLEYFFTAGPDEVRAWTIRVRFILIHQLYPVPHYWIQIDITDFEVCHGGG